MQGVGPFIQHLRHEDGATNGLLRQQRALRARVRPRVGNGQRECRDEDRRPASGARSHAHQRRGTSLQILGRVYGANVSTEGKTEYCLAFVIVY